MKMFIRNVDGVAAVEFALIAPALILLILGMFDFGMYMNTTMKLENTARAAAEYLHQGGDPDNLEDDIIMDSSLDLTDETRDTVTVTNEYVCACGDDVEIDCDDTCEEDVDGDSYRRRYLEVTLNMDYEPMFPYPGLPQTMVLGGFVRLQVE